MTPDRTIFVFGSNLAGRHGAGSAFAAVRHHGAIMYQGVGLQGNSYAIPTLSGSLNKLSLATIQQYIADFIQFTRQHPTWEFNVVAIGCGIAGFTVDEIAPMFRGAPSNCNLPAEFTSRLRLDVADPPGGEG